MKPLDVLMTVKKVQKNWTLTVVFSDCFKTCHGHEVFEGLSEVSGSTEFNNKETGVVLSTILKKIRKKCNKGSNFLGLFDGRVLFFQERSIKIILKKLRCNQCIRTLHLSYQTALIFVCHLHFSKEGPL